ncbi:MAG: serine hydrolase [Proteobacteria bacterium]|nr:serine hydrolase [Pseudomonadota bacterium]
MSFDATSYQNKLESCVEAAKLQGLFTHCAYAVGFLPQSKFKMQTKSLDLNASDLVFDLSSVTKAICGTPLVLRHATLNNQFENENLQNLFSGNSFLGIELAKELNFKDVIRHEAGLPFWKNFYVSDEKSNQRAIEIPLFEALRDRPNIGKNVYSDITFILLGHILQKTKNINLETLWGEFLASELKLEISQAPRPASNLKDLSKCVSTGFCYIRNRILLGEVHDENAWALGGFTLHSGLFGSVNDIVRYLEAFFKSDIGQKIWKLNCHYAHEFNNDSAFGFRTGRDEASFEFGSGNSLGHWGFTGTSLWINPNNCSYLVLLTNRVEKSRVGNLSQMKAFRKSFFKISQEYISAASKT